MSTTSPTARTGCLPAMEPWWEVVLPKGGSARGSGSVDALKSAAPLMLEADLGFRKEQFSSNNRTEYGERTRRVPSAKMCSA